MNDYGFDALTIDIMKAVLTVIWLTSKWKVFKVETFRTVWLTVVAYSI
jgi:hypothetical protein